MIWLIFPLICLYFLIGSMFSDVFKSELGERDVISALWFLLWPVFTVVLIVYVSLLLIQSAFAYISMTIREIYTYFKSRKKRHDVR